LITNYTAQQNILCSSYDIVDRDDIDLCFFLIYYDLLRFPNQLRFIRQHQQQFYLRFTFICPFGNGH